MKTRKLLVVICIVSCIVLGCTACKKTVSSEESYLSESIIFVSSEIETVQSTNNESGKNTGLTNEDIVSNNSEIVNSQQEWTTSSDSITAVDNSSSNSSATNNSFTSSNTVLHPISGLPFKQLANPETGISWDGVSPIIYTYTDGTTGTEKRDSATYEQVPGMIATVVTIEYGQEMTPPTKPLTCDYCGKDANVCVRYWTGGDHDCPKCGVVIPEDTCHTCKE